MCTFFKISFIVGILLLGKIEHSNCLDRAHKVTEIDNNASSNTGNDFTLFGDTLAPINANSTAVKAIHANVLAKTGEISTVVGSSFDQTSTVHTTHKNRYRRSYAHSEGQHFCGQMLRQALQLICNRKFHRGTESVESGSKSRKRRGVVKDCCRNSCTIPYLQLYCEYSNP